MRMDDCRFGVARLPTLNIDGQPACVRGGAEDPVGRAGLVPSGRQERSSPRGRDRGRRRNRRQTQGLAMLFEVRYKQRLGVGSGPAQAVVGRMADVLRSIRALIGPDGQQGWVVRALHMLGTGGTVPPARGGILEEARTWGLTGQVGLCRLLGGDERARDQPRSPFSTAVSMVFYCR